MIKGGHLLSHSSSDVLYIVENETCYWFEQIRIDTQNTHGTGCSLSAAIASYLAQGLPLLDAVQSAKNYITQAITAAAGKQYRLGQGRAPIDHFYFLDNRK